MPHAHHRRLARRLVLVCLMAGALAGLAAPGAPAAAGTCSGSLIQRNAIKAGTKTIGELAIYYNRATGVNCARTNALGPAYGVAKYMDVGMTRCLSNVAGRYCGDASLGAVTVFDGGIYSIYAGPVSFNGRGRCIYAAGTVGFKGKSYSTHTPINGSHCS